MKQLLTLGTFMILAFQVNARSSGDRENIIYKHSISAIATKFELKGDSIVFSGLSRKASGVYVMDKNGTVELSGTVSRRHNTIDLSKLPKGNHLIAIKQGEKINIFGYLSEVVIR